MKYHYPSGTVRWFRWTSSSDVRAHRPHKGWSAEAVMLDEHPLTGRAFPSAQWWMKETYE